MGFYRDLDMLVGNFRKEKIGQKNAKLLVFEGEKWELAGGRMEQKADAQLHTACRKKGS